MSIRTPAGEASLGEVADDFADSLKDLAGNNRYEINNLTLIAQESTEHAHNISQALERHIRSTHPQRKLPALYVLDSIVKNVGTPYTVYLGRNLYSTFMEAYGLVDTRTRQSMEALLKTWREPVMGSVDGRPVFPIETVRPIENALAKAKAITAQYQRPAPTPPATNGYAPPHAVPQHYQHQQQYGYATPQPGPGPYMQPGYQQPPPQHAYRPPVQNLELDALKRDLSVLIRNTEQDKSRLSWDTALQAKLKSLYDLNTILHTQHLDAVSMSTVAAQIRSMSAQAVQPAPTPQWQQPYQQPPPQQMSYPGMQSNGQTPLPFSQSQLHSLQSMLQSVPKPSTPQMRAAVPSLQNVPHSQVAAVQAQVTAAPVSNGSDLMAALTKAGLVKTSTPALAPAQPATNTASSNLAALLGSLSKAAPTNASLPTSNKIDLNNKASLQVFRPALVSKLYPPNSVQCPQCSRRFKDTPEGNKKKNLHLDWHFRINQRKAESGRGHHRNWYPSEMDWVKLVEFDESTVTADAAAASRKDTSKVNTAAQKYVRAPAGVNSTTCSICYEEMRSSHPAELEDWVFMDAAINNGKIVHATCLEELQNSAPAMPMPAINNQSLAAALASLGSTAREGSRTPDSALGKRKAENDAGGEKKMLKEG